MLINKYCSIKNPKLLVLMALLIVSSTMRAYEKRDLLQKSATLEQIKNVVVTNRKWMKYPAYADRNGWDKLTADNKAELIKAGEAKLNYEWKVIKATDYLEFDRSGSRKIMEDPAKANEQAITALVYAELAEGNGRFIDQIANGVWFYCEQTSWVLSAHTAREQDEKTALPSYKQNTIDLTSGDMGAFFAWVYVFLKDPMDKVQPLISARLRQNLETRILTPYLTRDNFWWQALNASPTNMVNNWNPWCNSDALQCFMLLEENKDRLAETVYRSMRSVDQFINYYHSDGACEEGPSYWGHAPGKLYDYLQLLSDITGAKVSIFDEPLIRRMGEYIADTYIGDGWVVNFADAHARAEENSGLIYRYGKAVQSKKMVSFAAMLQGTRNTDLSPNRDMYRSIEDMISIPQLSDEKSAFKPQDYVSYPETQLCFMRSDNGFFLGAKGGNNAESHNHNDVGSFVLFSNNKPVFIDAGVGVYTRQTFSNERYSIWTMQSNYHNLPMINGIAQSAGGEFKARNAVFDSKSKSFVLDISPAYNKSADVDSWVRTYRMNPDKIIIEDVFALKDYKAPNKLNFLLQSSPDIASKAKVMIATGTENITMSYDDKLLQPFVEEINITDDRLLKVWGKKLYRLTFTSRNNQIAGKYRFVVSKK